MEKNLHPFQEQAIEWALLKGQQLSRITRKSQPIEVQYLSFDEPTPITIKHALAMKTLSTTQIVNFIPVTQPYDMHRLQLVNPLFEDKYGLAPLDVYNVNHIIMNFVGNIHRSSPMVGDLVICKGISFVPGSAVPQYPNGLVQAVDDQWIYVHPMPGILVFKDNGFPKAGGYCATAHRNQMTLLGYAYRPVCMLGPTSAEGSEIYFHIPVKAWELISEKIY